MKRQAVNQWIRTSKAYVDTPFCWARFAGLGRRPNPGSCDRVFDVTTGLDPYQVQNQRESGVTSRRPFGSGSPKTRFASARDVATTS